MWGTDRQITAKLSLLFAATAVVCLGQMPSIDSAAAAAKVIELTGQVSVLKDASPWALQVGDQIQVRQLIITGADGQARFEVSDGSTFEVYPNSRVVFRKNAPNWKDLLDVLVGRVKVHIEHLYGPNPNRVLTPTAVISVRGTTFEISVGDDDETTLVEVEEGVVEVRHALLPGNARTLNSGESTRIYRNEPIASSRFDKGDIAKRGMRMLVDAINTWESRVPKSGGVGGTPGGVGVGDTGKKAPPPLPPPPPPPPPPPAHYRTSDGQSLTVLIVQQHHGRLYRASHAVTHAVLRYLSGYLLGPQPGTDVIRALQY
jgi:hypothetical protein